MSIWHWAVLAIVFTVPFLALAAAIRSGVKAGINAANRSPLAPPSN